MTEKRLELVRGLGPWASAAIVVGTMIGTGIFLKPAEMAREGRSVSVVFAAWIVGGILSLFGALSFAELGASIPEAGGEYAYLRRGFGPAWGFLFGWMHSIVGRPASAASIAAGLMRFLGFFVPAVAAPIFTWHIAVPGLTGWLKPYDFVFTWAQPLGVFWLVLMTGINYLGVRLGGGVQVFLTAIKILSVLLVIGVAFALPVGAHASNPVWPSAAQTGLLSAFLAALAAALWAYDGWEDLNLVGSEVKDPERNIPRALVWGVSLVALIYLLFSAACLKVLSFESVANSTHVASDVVERAVGHGAAAWITLAMAISALGSMNSSVLSGARVPYAMARDHRFFSAAARVHPQYCTPSVSILALSVWSAVVVLSGRYEQLFTYVIFASWILYGMTAAAVIVLRRKRPDLPRPYRTLAYPVLPVLFVVAAILLVLSTLLDSPRESLLGLGLIILGLPFYFHWKRRYPEGGSSQQHRSIVL